MTSAMIAEVTAALGAITPNTVQGRSDESQPGVLPNGKEPNTALRSSAFNKYNRQMLISNYLNRGKETQVEASATPDKGLKGIRLLAPNHLSIQNSEIFSVHPPSYQDSLRTPLLITQL
ncbi:hypothetical protein DFH28DRAFT_923096 [Melampsora americana]|nr:hypothetical protein DFH28DRAFT_923096 [Melampsora americana]